MSRTLAFKGCVAVVLLVGGVVGCTPDRTRRRAVETPGEVGGAPDEVGAPDVIALRRVDALAAMLSVHAHAFWPDRDFPEGLAPVTLERAAAFLADDDERLAPSRRRRAIARLGAYGLDRPDFRRALVLLRANPRAMVLSLEGPAAEHGPSFLRDPVRVEQYLLQQSGALTAATCAWDPVSLPTPAFQGAAVVIDREIRVERDAREVARAIDPQSWDECSKFFEPPERTYLVESRIASGGDIEPVLDAAGDFIVRYHPRGMRYGPELLHEHFACSVSGCINTVFRNLLDVATAWDMPRRRAIHPKCPSFTGGISRYNVAYSLDPLTGPLEGTARIVLDEGGMWAQQEPAGSSWTRVCSTKTLQFDDPKITGAAKAVLAAEQGGELAEMACCAVP